MDQEMAGLSVGLVNPIEVRFTTATGTRTAQCHFWRTVSGAIELYEVENGRLVKVGVYDDVQMVHETGVR